MAQLHPGQRARLRHPAAPNGQPSIADVTILGLAAVRRIRGGTPESLGAVCFWVRPATGPALIASEAMLEPLL